jgi:hypothetical protein
MAKSMKTVGGRSAEEERGLSKSKCLSMKEERNDDLPHL